MSATVYTEKALSPKLGPRNTGARQRSPAPRPGQSAALSAGTQRAVRRAQLLQVQFRRLLAGDPWAPPSPGKHGEPTALLLALSHRIRQLQYQPPLTPLEQLSQTVEGLVREPYPTLSETARHAAWQNDVERNKWLAALHDARAQLRPHCRIPRKGSPFVVTHDVMERLQEHLAELHEFETTPGSIENRITRLKQRMLSVVAPEREYVSSPAVYERSTRPRG